MSISTNPLSYCTNVHPGRSITEVERGLDNYTIRVRDRYGHPLAAGLWLSQPVVRELFNSPDRLPRFAADLSARGLTCYTMNAFPYGDFHDARVKENAYIPDWSHPDRLEYTTQCARILATLLPEEMDGSLSTVPLGFKNFEHPNDLLPRSIEQLIELARRLDRLHQNTGRLIRLAIEPEPFCLLETTSETIEFFELLRQQAVELNELELVNRYLGVCYDVCHQAVEFEDISESISALNRSGVRINKVHITCALELDHPANNPEGLRALVRYAEPRYLHQTLARTNSGQILRVVDLTKQLAIDPEPSFRDADAWRIHFHVPVDAESLGPLRTTRTELKQALTAVADLDYAPHLEVETYTWEVLPNGQTADLVEGLTQELTATWGLLTDLTGT